MKFFGKKDVPDTDSLEQEHPEERLAALREEATSYVGVREAVFKQMLKRNEPKYKWFIMGIRFFKLLSGSSPRGQFLENYYVAMRYIDDIADGDVPLPSGYNDAEEYISKKLEHIESGTPPADDCENLLALSFKLAKEFGVDFSQETEDILQSLQFDARRRGKYQIFPDQELKDHFFKLDIRGTVMGDLKIFNENSEHYKVLQPLGEASRIYYNLHDFKEDVTAGFINISVEDCARLGITADILKSGEYTDHQGLMVWFREQAEKGLALIEEYQTKRKGVSFQPVTRMALKLGFEMGAKKFMASVASGDFAKIFER